VTLTPAQWIAVAIGMLGVFATGGTQLDVIVGVTMAKVIVAICTLTSAALSVPLAILTGQGSVLRQVQAMPGVEKITVNAQANQTVAQLATNQSNPKIEATPGAQAAVSRTAAGGNS